MTTPQGRPTIWLVDSTILLLYITATALVFLLREVNDYVCSVSAKRESNKEPLPAGVILAVTSLSNLLGVASVVLLANSMSSETRLSMLALPLVVLVERYWKIMKREPDKRPAAAAALAGSLAGIGGGAWLFVRKIAAAEPLARIVVPGDVKTVPLSKLLTDGGSWTISLLLVLFYVISLSIFFGLHALMKRIDRRLRTRPPEKLKHRTTLTGVLAFALNFLGVVVFVLLAKYAAVQVRAAMVGLPLILIAESYARDMRLKQRNPYNYTGLIGSSAGIALAGIILLRGAPFH